MPTYHTALVTGGAGFIGSHIVDALIRRHVKVFVVDDLSNGTLRHVNPNATFTKMSLTNPQFPSLLARIKPEIVFHAAAHIDLRRSVHEPSMDARTNIMGTLALIEAAPKAGIKKIVFSSTGGPMYSANARLPWKESYPASPIAPYAIAKRSAEMYLGFLHTVQGIPFVALRYANVYGPRQNHKGEAGVVAIFAQRLLSEKAITIFGDGKQTRDFVYVGDVVEANMRAMNGKTSGIFNIGTGKEVQINSLFKTMKKLVGSNALAQYGPGASGDLARSALSFTHAHRELGWTPKTSLQEGLKKTIEWYAKKNN